MSQTETEQPETPKKKRRTNQGLTKETRPKLSNRLPREKGGIIMPIGDGLTPFERALMMLGSRVKRTRQNYILDGVPCSAFDIMKAGGQ